VAWVCYQDRQPAVAQQAWIGLLGVRIERRGQAILKVNGNEYAVPLRRWIQRWCKDHDEMRKRREGFVLRR